MRDYTTVFHVQLFPAGNSGLPWLCLFRFSCGTSTVVWLIVQGVRSWKRKLGSSTSLRVGHLYRKNEDWLLRNDKPALSFSKFSRSYWSYRHFPPSSGRFWINIHTAVKSIKLTWHSDIHHKQLLESSGNVLDPTGWSSSPAGNCISVCQVPVLPLACSWQPAWKRLIPAHRPALLGLHKGLDFSNSLKIICFCAASTVAPNGLSKTFWQQFSPCWSHTEYQKNSLWHHYYHFLSFSCTPF